MMISEPNRWFERFLVYRDLGPARRLILAYRKLGGKLPDVPAAWRDAFDRWQWRERADEWDRQAASEIHAESERLRLKERDERIILLKAGRSRLIQAMNKTGENGQPTEGFASLIAGIATINGQLREEQGE